MSEKDYAKPVRPWSRWVFGFIPIIPYGDPIGDGLNWYTYCENSPVVFIDPSGLVLVPLEEYAKTYDGEVVTWRESGGSIMVDVSWEGKTFTRWANPPNNIVKQSYINGVFYVDDSIFVNAFGVGTDTIVVYHDTTTNHVSIRAAFNITGDAINDRLDGVTYKYLFLNGIQENWSGSFGIYEVSTYARESSKGIKVRIGEVNLNAKKDNSYMTPPLFGWSPSNPGSVTMRTGDSRSGAIYASDQFKWVAAHEFGHLLGVGDAYSSKNSTGVTSIFNNFGTSVQAGDISKVLKAQSTGKWQKWS